MRRRVVVTGGNRGLGLETCVQLARLGHHVILTARAFDKAKRAALDLAESGLEVEPAALDVTEASSVDAFAERIGAAGTAVLVNNAAIAMKGFDAHVARETIATNFFGALRVTERLLPSIPDGGAVVMVSSGVGSLDAVSPALAARFSDPGLRLEELIDLANAFVRDVEGGVHTEKGWPSSAYAVSKVSLNALTRILARDLTRAGRRVLVNAVCPGWVRTDMGGDRAERSVEQGADGIVWAATLGPEGPSGLFFRDRHPIDW